jgi:hypothetical protein
VSDYRLGCGDEAMCRARVLASGIEIVLLLIRSVWRLRIYARGADGRERMFEYREGSTVDGSQFRGWDRGEWGQEGWSGRWEGGSNNGVNYNGGNYNGGDARDAGQYVILSAQYGTKNHHVDVTDRLKELARRDRTFYMNNNTFGVDPDRGRTKVLRIYTRGPDGRQRKFEYREGSPVDGSQFSSWAAASGPTNAGLAVGRVASEEDQSAV